MKPTALATPADALPAFDLARQHAAVLTTGVKTTVAATIAFGLELLHIRETLGYNRGGDRTAPDSADTKRIPWKTLVQDQTGFSYASCNRFTQTAQAIRDNLLGTPDGKASLKAQRIPADLRAMLANPPRVWTPENYAQFAEFIGSRYPAQTFSALMAQIFGEPKPTLAPADPDSAEDTYNAVKAACDCVVSPIESLARTYRSPDAWHRHLHALPLKDEGDITGLQTIATHLSQFLNDITQEIQNRKTTPTKSKSKTAA